MSASPLGGRVWRVYRFEDGSGRYIELATNALKPEQIQLPPEAEGYKFVKATPLVPAGEAEARVSELEGLIADFVRGVRTASELAEAVRS